MESTFRVYLPSNASTDVFPKNKPSDYQVQLNPPLKLDGEWEVGVENVYYNSTIQNVNETEDIKLSAYTDNVVSLNDSYDFPYVLTKDGKWNYQWHELKSTYYGHSDMKEVCKTLNSGNALILKNRNQRVYKFGVYRRPRRMYRFISYSSGLTIKLHPKLCVHLGFGHGQHVNQYSRGRAQKVDYSKTWGGKSFYSIVIFDENVVECEEHIILKKSGEKAPSLDELVKRWNDTLGKKYGETADAISFKLIINKLNEKLTFSMSPGMRNVTHHYTTLIGRGTFWPINPYYAKANTKDEEWSVDVYGDRIKSLKSHDDYTATISTSPRQYHTVESFIQKINPHLEYNLKSLLKSKYDVKLHQVLFSIEDQKTVFILGTQITCELSENLMKLFGFTQKSFSSLRTVSLESPLSLDKREQHLYIQSDLIPPILFGDRKEYILRDFIHDKDSKYGIVEKAFEPILFHPIIKQNIPVIHLKITNGLHECIHQTETKSLVTLIFRKAK